MAELSGLLRDFAGPLFQSLSEAELDLLSGNVSEVTYHVHEVIVKQGSFASNCILVKSGLIKLYMEGGPDKVILLDFSFTCDLAGLQDLYSNGRSSYSASAISEAEIFLIRNEAILQLMKSNPDFTFQLLGQFSQRQHFLYGRLFSLGTKQMHGRLADVILYLTGPKFHHSDIFNHISRKDIAEMSGMSTESAVRLLKEFRDDGLIAYEGKEILVKNRELLERLSRIG